MTDVPHFAYPFRFAQPGSGQAGLTPQIAVQEQDSVDEIATCVNSILLCPVGFRDELVEFGIVDPTFSVRVDLDALADAIELWEPRARAVLSEVNTVDELLTQIQTLVTVRTED